MKALLILCFSAACLTAQTANPLTKPKTAAIRGSIFDLSDGQPVSGYKVYTSLNNRPVDSVTANDGSYKLDGLVAGTYRLTVAAPNSIGQIATRRVTIADTDVEKIDFRISRPATISGQVLDENKEPMPDMFVVLVGSEYHRGHIAILL